MAKRTRDEVNKWAKQQNLDIDDIFNKSEKEKRKVKVGDSVHVTRLKNRKVDIMREVTNVNSDYFTIKHALSDILELKVHFTDEYEIVPSTPFEKDYKRMYEEVCKENERLKARIEEAIAVEAFRHSAMKHYFVNDSVVPKNIEKSLRRHMKKREKQRKKYGFGGITYGKDEF